MKSFKAPWNRESALTFAAFTACCLGVPYMGFNLSSRHPVIGWAMFICPLFLLIFGLSLMVRGYRLEPGSLIIRRVGWSKRFDLSSLVSAIADPSAMNDALRYLGQFQNDKLGDFRAFGADPKRAVILQFKDQIVVVTPDHPEDFVKEITKMK